MTNSIQARRSPGAANRQSHYRRVTQDMHDRCFRARRDRGTELTEAEALALAAVATAWEANLPVTKRELDRAAGILGRLRA